MKLPAALPHIFGGFKVAVTLAVIGAVIGEFVGAESGLGYMIVRAQSHFRTDQVFAALFLLGVLGMVMFMGFTLMERLAIPWYARMKRLQSVVVSTAVLCGVAFTWSPTAILAQTPESVSFGLDWVVYGKHAMFYAAIEQGIYQKHGLSVTMKRGFGSGDTIQKIDQKAVQFGFGDMGSLVLLRAKGAKVTTVGMFHHVMPHAVVFLKGGAIRTPKDLEEARASAPPRGALSGS